MERLDKSKFRFKIGDVVLYEGKPCKILAYYFSSNFNDFNYLYGYTLEWLSKQSHTGSNCSYNKVGEKQRFKDETCWYVSEENVEKYFPPTKERTIHVVYTTRPLSIAEIRMANMKRYMFLCKYDMVQIGDILVSPMYNTPMQVVEISNNTNKMQNGITLKNIIIDTINGVKPEEITSNKFNNNQNSNKMEKKSMFSSFIEKYKSQFIPEKDNTLKVSMDGNICVLIGEEYIGIDKDNNLISYPEEMCMDMPVYLLTKPYSQIHIGDIVKVNHTYAKVLKKNGNGSLSCLSFSGYTQNKKEIKDFMLGQSFIKVVVNIFSNMQVNGFNPMILAMAESNMDMKDLMLMQMMQEGNTGQMNPMLMVAMMDKDGGNSMLETILMMQMIGGQMNFPFMPNQNNKE